MNNRHRWFASGKVKRFEARAGSWAAIVISIPAKEKVVVACVDFMYQLLLESSDNVFFFHFRVNYSVDYCTSGISTRSKCQGC